MFASVEIQIDTKLIIDDAEFEEQFIHVKLPPSYHLFNEIRHEKALSPFE